jgi:hypothetical protein
LPQLLGAETVELTGREAFEVDEIIRFVMHIKTVTAQAPFLTNKKPNQNRDSRKGAKTPRKN